MANPKIEGVAAVYVRLVYDSNGELPLVVVDRFKDDGTFDPRFNQALAVKLADPEFFKLLGAQVMTALRDSGKDN